jgi:site-specific DNA recombinase
MKKQSDKTVALYCRAAGRQTDGVNLENQIQILLCYAKERGLAGFTLYADNGASGITLDRPALNTLKADIEAGHVGEVAVADLSRVARNLTLFARFEAWAKSYGVGIVNVRGGETATLRYADIAAVYRSSQEGGKWA